MYTLDAAWLTTFFLLSLRLAAVFLMTPLLAATNVPAFVRIFLILGFAAALSLGLPETAATPTPTTISELFLAAFCELALGATLALGILLAFAAFSVAGNLLDIQIGFGLGQVFDPATNTSVPILTAAFNQVAVLCFFLLNGHHALLRGLSYSLERIPLGQSWLLNSAATPVLKQVGGIFSLGFALAAPIIFGILMVDMALAVVARNLPQMNMLSMGIPGKIVIGLLALSIWFSGIGEVMARAYSSIYHTWNEIFVGKGPMHSQSAAAPGLVFCVLLCRSRHG